jgi:hypothetical protein
MRGEPRRGDRADVPSRRLAKPLTRGDPGGGRRGASVGRQEHWPDSPVLLRPSGRCPTPGDQPARKAYSYPRASRPPDSAAPRSRLEPRVSDVPSSHWTHAHNPGLRLEPIGDRQRNALGTFPHCPPPKRQQGSGRAAAQSLLPLGREALGGHPTPSLPWRSPPVPAARSVPW